jgi:putative PIN family toxin of toxin-antitoxin system
MSRRLVLDTNVLVSGMINPFGAPGRIVDLLREGELELTVDDRILAEYSAVLNRRKFRAYFTLQEVRDILVFLEQNTHYTVATTHVSDLPDLKDAPFLEVALAAGVPLVTGNADHFPASRRRSVAVVAPADYVERHAV